MMRHHHCGVCVLAVLAGVLPRTAAAQEATDVTALAPIVVSSTKRSEDDFVLPSTVDLADAEALQMRDIDTVADLDRIFPDVNIRTRSSRAYSNFTIRGQASLDFYNPSTQVYVDGLPQDSFNLSRSLPGGVESVELLYGPQGTLYGRGAIGGVINITTRRPDDELRLGFDGDIDTQGADASVFANLPIIDGVLFGDATVTALHGKDRYKTMTLNEDVGGTDDVNGQVRLRYAPDDSPFDVMVTAGRGYVSSTEEYFVMESMIESRTALPIPSEYTLDTWHTGINASYDLGPATITALTGYQKSDFDRTVFGSYTPEQQWTLSQELRIASNPGEGNALDYVAGVYYQHLDFTRDLSAYGQIADQKVDSYAMFADVTWHATDRLDIAPGLRFDYERAAAAATGLINFERDNDFMALSPKLGASFGLTDEWRLYGQLSTGFKAGGFTRTVSSLNNAFTYDPQTTYNGEVGLKYRNDAGTLETQVSGYYNVTKDYQMFVGVQPFQYLQNAGEVTAKGIDVKVRAMPVDEFGITVGLSYNHSEFTAYSDPTGSGADYTGHRVPYAPEVTANLMVDYTVELETGALVPYAALTYLGDIYFDETNTLGQESYALVDMGVKWELNDMVAAEVFVTNLFDKTYTTYGFNAGAPYGNVYQLGEGRVIGARLDMTF